MADRTVRRSLLLALALVVPSAALAGRSAQGDGSLVVANADGTLTVQVKDQDVVPAAGSQEAPPSVDTSTPETRPPPESAAVPAIVIDEPAATDAPLAGEVIVEVGGARSVDAVAATRPSCTCSVPGCAPMSAKRLTVACCIRRSAGSEPRSCDASRPQVHWTVPAPKTSAPLAWR